MSKIDFSLTVDKIEINNGSYNTVDINLEGVDEDSVIDLIGITDYIKYYGVDDILSEIDRDDAIKYYEIEEA